MSATKFRPYVPDSVQMREFTFRAVLLGLVLSVVLGAANAYLGLRAGITIAATYPAAVISMAVLRFRKGSILEENLARTAGSIGESVAAGAIFTLPAFMIARVWPSFSSPDAYWKSTVLMVMGGVLGVLFVSLMRRVMVEDPELPFPESVAAAEIHKAGQSGAQTAKFLFYNMGVGAIVYLLGVMRVFAADWNIPLALGGGGAGSVRIGPPGSTQAVAVGGISTAAAPSVSPAYLGVGFIIGPQLASLNFAGGVFAWGLLIPLLIYFLGPQLQTQMPGSSEADWQTMSNRLWTSIVRPIAVGGMLVGASYTLFRMRRSLSAGIGRALAEVRAGPPANVGRTERYMSSKVIFAGIAASAVLMAFLYIYLSGQVVGGIVAAVVMLITGFFFATISGSLVGFIGSSNNPISGLTLSTVIIAALLMVALGVSGAAGVAAILGVAAVVCVSSAVAGELLQDFKVGYILGGTPRTIQIVELVSVVLSSLVMYIPLLVLHEGNIKSGGIGFGDPQLPAPQAGLMASISQGIVGGDMPWVLVIAGMLMGVALILSNVRSPMLFATGMYLPLATTFAIFVGGLARWGMELLVQRRAYTEGQRTRMDNIGILVASGLIAGEALVGLLVATLRFFDRPLPGLPAEPQPWTGMLMMAFLLWVLIRTPLSSPGRPEDPAPPTAIV